MVYGLGFNKEAQVGEFLIPYAACLYRICELTLHLLLDQHLEHVPLTIPTRVHRQVHLHVKNVFVKCIVMKVISLSSFTVAETPLNWQKVIASHQPGLPIW